MARKSTGGPESPRRRAIGRAWILGYDEGIYRAYEDVETALSSTLGYDTEASKRALEILRGVPELAGLYEKFKSINVFMARRRQMERQLAQSDAIRARSKEAVDPAVKAARTKQLKRALRDEEQAIEFAALIRAGHTTDTARAKMDVGDVKAKRLRALAVRMKWLEPQQRTRQKASK